MIKRDDISLDYTGNPDEGLMLRATLLCQTQFVMSEQDQDENVLQAHKMVSQMINTLYGEIKESLMDILEEYQMRHGGHKSGQNKLQGMIEELIDRIPK